MGSDQQPVSDGESAAGEQCPICEDHMSLIEGDEDNPDVYRCHQCNKEIPA